MRLLDSSLFVRPGLFVLALALSVGLLLPATDCRAAKSVKLQFEPGWAPDGLDSGNVQQQVVQRFNNHFGFAGADLYVFTNCNTTAFQKLVRIVPDEDPNAYGRHTNCQSINFVFGGSFKTDLAAAGLNNSTAAARVIARTAAHEVGHHWGVDHPPNHTANVTNIMGSPPIGDRAATDGSFSGPNQSELMSYIRTDGRNKGDGGGDFRDCDVTAVFGQYPTPTYRYDDNDFFDANVQLFGDVLQYTFGWMNVYGEFVQKLDEGASSDNVTFFCGYVVDFAIQDNFTGEIFRASDQCAIEYFDAIPPELSSCPVVTVPYYAQIVVNWPAQGFSAQLDARTGGQNSGFVSYGATSPGIPSVREWGLVVLAVLLMGYAVFAVSTRMRRNKVKA